MTTLPSALYRENICPCLPWEVILVSRRLLHITLLLALALFATEATIIVVAQVAEPSQQGDFMAPLARLMPGQPKPVSMPYGGWCRQELPEVAVCSMSLRRSPFLSAEVHVRGATIQTLSVKVAELVLGDLILQWGKPMVHKISNFNWLIGWNDQRFAYISGMRFSYQLKIDSLYFTLSPDDVS